MPDPPSQCPLGGAVAKVLRDQLPFVQPEGSFVLPARWAPGKQQVLLKKAEADGCREHQERASIP